MKGLAILALLITLVCAEYRIENSRDCHSCASSYNKVCKDPYNPSIKYCCGFLDFSENCGGNNSQQCTNQITDEGDYTGTGASYLLCEEELNECRNKEYFAYSSYYNTIYESNLAKNSACVIKFTNSEIEGAKMKLKHINVYGMQAYVYKKSNDRKEFYEYQETLSGNNDEKLKVDSSYGEPLLLILAPEESSNSIQFDYKMKEAWHHRGLGAGGIVGIVIGSVAFVLLCCCCCRLAKKKRQQRRQNIQAQAPMQGVHYNPNISATPASQYIAVQSEPNPRAYPHPQPYINQPRYVPQVNQMQQNQVLPPYPVAQPPPQNIVQNPQNQPLLPGVNTSQPSTSSNISQTNNYIPLTPAYPVETRKE